MFNSPPSQLMIWPLRALAASATLLVVACASPQPPTQQMSAAAAVLAQAAGSGGLEFAPFEMQLARDKLSRANMALDQMEYREALALSREAELDAQLAQAKAESVKAQRSAVAAQEGNRILREEIQRKKP